MTGCTMHTHVHRHFAGTISPEAERAMRRHMPACDACRDLYRRQLLLAQLDPEALAAEERLARGLGLRPRRAAMAKTLGVMAAAAAVVLLLGVHRRPEGFASRGDLAGLGPPSSRVFVFDVQRGMRPTPAGDTLHNGDELAFAYENGAAKRRLAVFGVDEHGHVYWFHPAWISEADDPVAIPIEADDRRHELPEAVLQRFDGVRLEIRSLFLDEPLSVRRIEELVRQNPRGVLPIPGAVETSVSLSVIP